MGQLMGIEGRTMRNMQMALRNLMIMSLAVLAMAMYVSATPTSNRREYKQKVWSDKDESEYMKYYPDDGNYWTKRIIPAAAVGAFLSIMACLCCWTCVFCRLFACCCDCFKWCCCNFFCGTADPEEAGYTFKTRSILFLMYLIACAGLGGSCLYGHLAVDTVCDGAVALFDDTTNNVNEMGNVFDTMSLAMTAVGVDASNTADMMTAINNTKESVSKVKKEVDDFCKEGGNASNGSKGYFGLFAINVLWVLAAYCCKSCRCFAWTATLIGFGLVFLAWILMTVFLGTGPLLDDTCVQLQLWHTCKGVATADLPTNPSDPKCSDGTLRLDSFLKCPDTTDFNVLSYIQLLRIRYCALASVALYDSGQSNTAGKRRN